MPPCAAMAAPLLCRRQLQRQALERRGGKKPLVPLMGSLGAERLRGTQPRAWGTEPGGGLHCCPTGERRGRVLPHSRTPGGYLKAMICPKAFPSERKTEAVVVMKPRSLLGDTSPRYGPWMFRETPCGMGGEGGSCQLSHTTPLGHCAQTCPASLRCAGTHQALPPGV